MLRTVNAAKPATNATKPRMACQAPASLPGLDQHPHRKGIRVSAQVRFDPARIGNDPSRVIDKTHESLASRTGFPSLQHFPEKRQMTVETISMKLTWYGHSAFRIEGGAEDPDRSVSVR